MIFAIRCYVTLREVIHSFRTTAVKFLTRQAAVLISSFILCLQYYCEEFSISDTNSHKLPIRNIPDLTP